MQNISNFTQKVRASLSSLKIELLNSYAQHAYVNSFLTNFSQNPGSVLKGFLQRKEKSILDTIRDQLLTLSKDLMLMAQAYTKGSVKVPFDLSNTSISNLLLVMAAFAKNLQNVNKTGSLSQALLTIPEIDGTLVWIVKDKEKGGSGLLKNTKSTVVTVSSYTGNVTFAEELRNV